MPLNMYEEDSAELSCDVSRANFIPSFYLSLPFEKLRNLTRGHQRYEYYSSTGINRLSAAVLPHYRTLLFVRS